MSKTLKAFLILFIIISFAFTFYSVKAVEDESDYSEEELVDDTENETANVIKESTSSNSSLQTLSPSSVTSVSSKENYSQANLELNNILCIILISLGVLLVLFAIAILIRLKR